MEPIIYQRPTGKVETRANDSISSASSNDSQGFATTKKATSVSALSKQSSQIKIEKKREKRWKKNKIGKEDFFNKTTEFRTWLHEKKNIQFDTMSTPKAKKAFKKFITKWNDKKLDQKYYTGLGVYWAAASPGAYSHAEVPVLTPTRAEAKLKASSYTPLYLQDFSTFGKKEGKKALQELQRMEGFGSPSRPEEHVYDVPYSPSSSYGQGAAPGYKTLRKGSTVKPRPALSQLFQRPGEVATPRLESGEDEPVFANISRQRAISCHGRVQKPAAPPSAPIGPHGNENDDDSVRLRPPTHRAPRPHTEYHSNHTGFGFMRKKPRSTISSSSTDSDVSSISSSTTSTKSSLSSLSSAADRQSIISEAEYVSFGPKSSKDEVSRRGEYVSFQPKPPPRSSSMGSRSQQLRQVAQVVVAKAGATPAKNVPIQMKTMTPGKTLEAPMGGLPKKTSTLGSLPPPLPISAPPYSPDNDSQEMREVAKRVLARVGVTPTNVQTSTKMMTPGQILQAPLCSLASTPPPPPPPLTSSTPLNESCDKSLPLPPPEFTVDEVETGSPAFPAPPSPFKNIEVDTEYKVGEASRQGEAARERTPKSSKPPRPQLQKDLPAGKRQFPTSQEAAVPQVTQGAASFTRQHVMTPRHALTPGPLLLQNTRPTPCTKLQKRPSNEAVDSYIGVTPAKRIDLDVSYQSTFV